MGLETGPPIRLEADEHEHMPLRREVGTHSKSRVACSTGCCLEAIVRESWARSGLVCELQHEHQREQVYM